jgi:uncharacterized protein (DUF433 family)
MDNQYVEVRDGGYYVQGSRVSLASVVHAFLEGHSPESIQECYPALTLEQVYGALAFYLGHRAEVEAHVADKRRRYDERRQAARDADPEFYELMTARRKQMLAGRR